MLFDQLKRRAFISLLGGAAAWPLGVRAQQPGGMRRIGVLMPTDADNPDAQARAVVRGANASSDYDFGIEIWEEQQ